jgi:hypothetical protein
MAATPSDWHFINLRRCFLSCLPSNESSEDDVLPGAKNSLALVNSVPTKGDACILETPSDIALMRGLLSLLFSATFT